MRYILNITPHHVFNMDPSRKIVTAAERLLALLNTHRCATFTVKIRKSNTSVNAAPFKLGVH